MSPELTTRAVRDLLSNPDHWQQGEYNNDSLNPTCFCLAGAIAHVQHLLPDYAHLDANPAAVTLALLINDNEDEVHDIGASEVIVNFNDAAERTHADIINLLDKALTNA